MAVSRTGDWARARRLLTAAPQRLQAAVGAIALEATQVTIAGRVVRPVADPI